MLIHDTLGPSPVKSNYRHVGFARFPVSGNAVYRWEDSACRLSVTTIYENGIGFNYAVPRRVVQRSSALLVL